MFDVLDEGCEDMVQKLYFTSQNGQLFYTCASRNSVFVSPLCSGTKYSACKSRHNK